MRPLILPLLPLMLSAAACGSVKNPIAGLLKPPAAPTGTCNASSVHTLTLPQEPGQTGSATFPYSYEIHPASNSTLPTVVYISGGPGQTAIGTSADWLGRLPTGYGLLLTDPRGVGCNVNQTSADGTFSAPFYRSEYVADDIIAAIADAGLTNYLVYGISYGTVPATIVGSKADATAHPATGVVLEGVLGRATTDESNEEQETLWTAELAKQPTAQAVFSANPLPLGYTVAQWMQLIVFGMEMGVINTTNTDASGLGATIDTLDEFVKGALGTDTAAAAWLQTTAPKILNDKAVDMTVPSTAAFYLYIACQELMSDPDQDVLTAGQLVEPTAENLCTQAGLTLDADTYDAAKWPVKAPIYYLQGDHDPATPYALADYHFAAETTSTGRQMALIAGGGHNPFEYSLSACYQPVWEAMAAGGASFQTAVNGCNWGPGVTLSNATTGVSN